MLTRYLLVSMLIFFCNAHSLNEQEKSKHPNVLIGDDFGILNETDLVLTPNRAANNIPFSGSKDNFDYRYWQCFPRENISLIFEDTGSSPEEMENRDTMADLSIKVMVKPGVFHEYVMRRLIPADHVEARLHRWRKLLKSEQYACLEGDFGRHEHKTSENGRAREVYTWTFEKIKTKKGCDSYFDPCSPS